MTVTSTNARNGYQGPGAGPFAYTFRIYAETDLGVTKQDVNGNVTTLNWPADFTVAGVGSRSGGTITPTVALVAGDVLAITRNRPFTQLINFRNQGSMFPANIEDGFDQAVMLLQQQQDAIGRSFKVPSTIPPSSINPTIQTFLPGYYLRVRADGLGLEGIANVIASQNFQQAGVGSVIRTMNTKAAEIFTPYDFGAKGDGVTDDTTPLTNLFNELVALGGGRASLNIGTFKVASNLSVPAGVILDFTGGGVLQPVNGVTITVNGPIVAPTAKVFANALAGQGTIALKNSDLVHVRWFGAKGDGANDDTAAIQAAINCAINSGLFCTVMMGAGTFKTTSSITFSTGQTPITLMGVPWGTIGPSTASCTIKYTGAGGAIFQDNGQWSNYVGFGLRNFGSAAFGIKITSGGRNILFDVSFSQQQVGTSAFSTSALDFSSEYSYIDRCEFEVSGVGIFLRANAATSVYITRCLFDPGVGAFTGIKADAVGVKKLTITQNTFNFRAAGSQCADLSALTSSDLVLFEDNEIDGNTGYANAQLIKASNVSSLVVSRNSINHFGNNTDSPIIVTACRVVLRDNELFSFSNPVVRATDTASLISWRENSFSPLATMQKPIDEGGTSTSLHLIPVAIVAGVVTLHGELTDGGGEAVFAITAAAGTAFVINMAHPPDGGGAAGFMALGQKFTVLVKNASGGDIAAGNPTFAADFQLVGPLFEAPPNGKFSSITFVWNGTKAVELRRQPAASVISAPIAVDGTIPGYQHFTLGDATAGLRSLTLPDPRNVGDGARYTVKKFDASANHVRLLGGAANIDGAANFDLTAQNEAATFVSRLSDVSYWIESRKT